MIEYTLDEIRVLAGIYQEDFPFIDHSVQGSPEHYDYSTMLVLEGVIRLEKEPQKILTEFIDNRDFVSLNGEDYSLLFNLLFEFPLIEMPKFINYSDAESWKSRIARWRLKIGK